MDAGVECRDRFSKYTNEFLNALSGVYPECPGIAALQLKFKIGVEHATASMRDTNQKMMIETFHATMQPFYERLTNRDATVFRDAEQSVELLRDLRLSQRWGEASPDTRDCIYAYLDHLCSAAKLHGLCGSITEKMTPSMLAHIQVAASNIKTQLDSGNNIDLMGISQKVAAQIDPGELNNFANGLMADPKAVHNLMQMMQSSGMQSTGP